MKIYAIFPNPKSGLIEEQSIETENYTQDELRDIAFYDIFSNNWGRETDADTLSDYRLKISLDVYDFAGTKYLYVGNKYMDIISEDDLEEIAEALCNLVYDNPTTEVINGCKDGLLGLLALAQNPYNPEGYRVLYKVLETIVDVQEV